MSIPNLPTNFKDDILNTSVNSKRKYKMINNTGGTVSFEDKTDYTQEGSEFGAGQVNQTNEAINNIYDERILSPEEAALVTEPGFFVDAMVVSELIENLTTLQTNFRNYYSGTNGYIDDIYVYDGDRYFCVMSNQGTDGISNLYTVGILEINNTATSCTYRSLHNTLSNNMTWTISNNLLKVNVSDRQYLSLLLLKINAGY